LDPAMVEINETNYCDQKPVTMQFSFEEHVVINDILNHALDAYDFTGYNEIYDLPDDSSVKHKTNPLLQKYEELYGKKEEPPQIVEEPKKNHNKTHNSRY